MKTLIPASLLLIAAVVTQSGTSAQQAPGDGPSFSQANELMRPTDFREWIFVSSGLGMTYNEAASGAPARVPNLTNVYVNPSSYRSFMKTGQWPDKTMFVLEIRGSQSEGSINKGGNFQSGLRAMRPVTRYPRPFQPVAVVGDKDCPGATTATLRLPSTNAWTTRLCSSIHAEIAQKGTVRGRKARGGKCK